MDTRNLTRRRLLQTGAAGLATATLGRTMLSGNGDASEQPRPNVLFLLCDQWRAQALSCYGDPNIETTHIDALASEGVRFSRCYTNSPVCTPYRAMLMSGRYPTKTGVHKNNVPLATSEQCLAETFRDAGYATGYVGKWHLNGPEKPGFIPPGPRRQGWEHFVGHNRGHKYFGGIYFEDTPEEQTIPEGVFEPDFQADLAMDWIGRQAKQEKPWFCMLSWGGPHSPYEAPAKYMDMFDPRDFTLRPNVDEFGAPPDGVSKKWEEKYYGVRDGVSAARLALQGYYAHAKALDDNVGRLMGFLRKNGLAENTLVVLTSDHGDMHHSQGQVFKSKPWEEAIGVPLVACLPSAIPGAQVVDSPISSIDLYPSLCGLCGIRVPDGKDGADCAHLFLGQPGPENQSVFLTLGFPSLEESQNGWRGVRTPRYTYAWKNATAAPWVLYDNDRDPYQQQNLAGVAGMEDLQRDMHERLVHWLRKVNDPFLANLS